MNKFSKHTYAPNPNLNATPLLLNHVRAFVKQLESAGLDSTHSSIICQLLYAETACSQRRLHVSSRPSFHCYPSALSIQICSSHITRKT